MDTNLLLYKATTFELKNRLQLEFWDDRLHPILRAFYLDLGGFTMRKFGKQIVLTNIFRTPEENEAVGGIPGSSHCDWRGADCRSSLFTETERVSMLEYVHANWGRAIHFIHEDAGTAPHFHANVNKAFLNEMNL